MDGVCKIECGGPLWQRLDLSLGSKYKNLRREKVHLHCIQEVNGIGVRVGKNLLDGLQPLVQFVIFLDPVLLIFPVGCKSLFGNIVHPPASDLYLNPLPVGSHHSEVKGLISVCLRMAHPVTDTVRTKLIDIGDGGIDVPALLLFIHAGKDLKDDTYSEQIVHFVELDTFVLHFVPDGIDRLYASPHLVLYIHFVKSLDDWHSKMFVNFIPFGRGLFDLLREIGKSLGVLVLETELFQFCFDGKQSQPVCQRGVYIQGFPGNFKLLRRSHGRECAHVVQSVGNLDQDYPDIIGHGEQQLPKILCLCRYVLAKHPARYLGQPVHNLRNLIPKQGTDIIDRVIGIFHHIVKQRRRNRGRSQPHLLRYDTGYCQRMHDVGFTGTAAGTFVCLLCHVKSPCDDIHLTTVVGIQVIIQQPLKFFLYHQIIYCQFIFVVHMLFLDCFLAGAL